MNEVTIYLKSGKTVKVKMTDDTYRVFASAFKERTGTSHPEPHENSFGYQASEVALFTVKILEDK